MQQAALCERHVLVYLCLVAERGHKAQHSSEGFYTKQVAKLYSARKHKKTACPRQLPGRKTHLYHDVHAVPKVCFRLVGAKGKRWNLVDVVNWSEL